jgi:hypothetical protein
MTGPCPRSAGLARNVPERREYVLRSQRQLLQRPSIAIGVAEGHERAPRLDVDLADLHTACQEFAPGGLDIGHHALHALLRAGRHRGDPGTQHNGAGRPGQGELHKPQRSVTW